MKTNSLSPHRSREKKTFPLPTTEQREKNIPSPLPGERVRVRGKGVVQSEDK